MFDDLGIKNVNDIYQEVYSAQEALVSDTLLGYFLALEEINEWTNHQSVLRKNNATKH